jgi:hypothetical protein
MAKRFDPETLQLLADSREIEIETSQHASARRHRTTIWVVVDDQGRALIRSVDGASARWFREAAANSDVTVHARDREIPSTAVLASDDDRIDAASRGYRDKYGRSRSTESMLARDILSTTLELVPR